MSKDKVIQTDETIKALLSKIEFQDWTINFRKHKEAPYLQLTFEAPCNVSGETQRYSIAVSGHCNTS